MPLQKCVHLFCFVTHCIVIEISIFGRYTRLHAFLRILNPILIIAASMVVCWKQGENASLEMFAFVLLCDALHSH